jgi:hypothetical protein
LSTLIALLDFVDRPHQGLHYHIVVMLFELIVYIVFQVFHIERKYQTKFEYTYDDVYDILRSRKKISIELQIGLT